MKTDEMDLLLRVAETGSMTRAARQLHLTPAAVSAAVIRIENDLKVRIFERTTRSLHPTDEGRVVLEGCRDVLSRWQRTLDDARDRRSELAGTVHLAAPADTSVQVLEPLLASLCRDHPQLRVVLAVSDTVQHLHQESLDLAIRYGDLDDSRLVARRLAEVPLVLVAAPRYLDEEGAPEGIDALADHRCISLHTANQPQVEWELHGPEGPRRLTVPGPLCGDGHLARRWAIAGMGIALKSLFDVIDDLEQGRLRQVLPEVSGGQGSIHLVAPSRRFQPARVRALREALVVAFADRAERCEAWLSSRGGA